MTLEINTRLGHYRIIGRLGRGGMADVYHAEDERLGREVALKAVPPEFASDPERVERFKQEVRAAAGLTHTNIITVYEFGQDASQHFYTMALMPGGDLKTRIRAHPTGIPPEEAQAVATAIARALDYAHRSGFVHRDVKPENILFDGEGTPHLTDFGIARALSSGTRMTATGTSLGSPHYMSPEQVRGQTVDGRSDLYSLGVMLHEMLTGRLPFDATDLLAVAYSHVNDPVPKLPAALAEWQHVLDRLLAKSPNDRFGTAGELAVILGSGTPSRPSVARPPRSSRGVGSAPPSKDLPKRHEEASTTRAVVATNSMSAGLMGGALVLAMLLIGAVWLQDGGTPERFPASGGGAAAGPAQARPAPPWNPENPFAGGLPEPAGPETEPAHVSERGTADLVDEEEIAAAGLEEALGLGRDARRLIQGGLLAAGFDTGGADGRFGPRTRAALRAWQAVSDAKATGYLDESAATTLVAAGEEALLLAVRRKAESEREAAARRWDEGAPGLVEPAGRRLTTADFQETAEVARRALRVNPDEAAAHLLLGQALYRQGKYIESIAPLERAIALGERVLLEVKHRHGGWGLRPGFCVGEVSLSRNRIAFRSHDTDHGFARPPDAISDARIVERVLGHPVQLNTEIEGRGSFDFLHPAVARTPKADGFLFTTGLYCNSCDGSLRVLESLMTTLTQPPNLVRQ
ncbi:MAG: protein kinase [Gammaproteobacteria bacterium]|nr:protein kinase [Gammaproteobacteria bacterium]